MHPSTVTYIYQFQGFIGVRVGFISDVHANVTALRTVLDDIEAKGVDAIYNSGDLVGYYPFPNETIELLRARNVCSIQGNHDRSVLDSRTERMNPWASSAVRWTAAHISDDAVRYLASLPSSLNFQIGKVRCSMHHGSPQDPDEYVHPERADQQLLELSNSWLLVLGHTHVPFAKVTEKGVIMNPGSVGQPRDGDPRSSYAIFDSDSGDIEHFRIAYDIAAVQEAVRKAGLPSSLGERLAQGW